MSKIDQFQEKYQLLINFKSIILVPKFVELNNMVHYSGTKYPYIDGKIVIAEREESEYEDYYRSETGQGNYSIKSNKNEPRNIISEFCLYIIVPDCVETIQVLKNGKWEEITNCVDSSRRGARTYEIPIDFNNRTEKLRIIFKFDLIEEAVLDFVYISLDRDTDDIKQQEFDMGKLVAAINASCKTGSDLANIVFKYATEEVELVKISLFDDKRNILAKYTVPQDMFFYAIKDLAFGSYYYQIHQYDKNGKLIAESAQTNFIIRLQDSFPTIVIGK